MAEYLQSAPDPIFLTSDEHFETRSVLVCFLIFFCAPSVATGSGDSHRTTKVKETSFCYFVLVELLVSASAGATAPLYGRILGWIWRFQFFACGILSNKCTLVEFFSHFSALLALWDILTGSTNLLLQTRGDDDVRLSVYGMTLDVGDGLAWLERVKEAVVHGHVLAMGAEGIRLSDKLPRGFLAMIVVLWNHPSSVQTTLYYL